VNGPFSLAKEASKPPRWKKSPEVPMGLSKPSRDAATPRSRKPPPPTVSLAVSVRLGAPNSGRPSTAAPVDQKPDPKSSSPESPMDGQRAAKEKVHPSE